MSDHRMSDHTCFADESAKISCGLEIAHVKLIQFKREKKSPLVVSRQGQIADVDPFGEHLELQGEAADKERLADIYELLPSNWSVSGRRAEKRTINTGS